MPTAYCRKCGKLATWRNQRGARLEDHRCSACQGPMARAPWVPGEGHVAGPLDPQARPAAPPADSA